MADGQTFIERHAGVGLGLKHLLFSYITVEEGRGRTECEQEVLGPDSRENARLVVDKNGRRI